MELSASLILNRLINDDDCCGMEATAAQSVKGNGTGSSSSYRPVPATPTHTKTFNDGPSHFHSSSKNAQILTTIFHWRV